MEGEVHSGVVVDTHLHPTDFLPRWARWIYRLVLRRTIPRPVALERAAAAGVSAMVVSAVGDPLVTRLHVRGGFSGTRLQLRRITAAVRHGGGTVARTAADIAAASPSQFAVVLGVEGGDSLRSDLSRLNRLYDDGVRTIVPVHLGNNRIGTTSVPWHAYMRRHPVASRRSGGLTRFGAAVIGRMNDLGMIVDVAHADEPTLDAMIAASRAPVIASHTGARAIADFPRFLSDEQIRAVAATGGVIGIWPYHYGGEGASSLGLLMRHARHIAHIAGSEHLCIGTDMNGVPGATPGVDDESAVAAIGAALGRHGFTPAEIRGILGENFLRVFRAVEDARSLG